MYAKNLSSLKSKNLEGCGDPGGGGGASRRVMVVVLSFYSTMT